MNRRTVCCSIRNSSGSSQAPLACIRAFLVTNIGMTVEAKCLAPAFRRGPVEPVAFVPRDRHSLCDHRTVDGLGGFEGDIAKVEIALDFGDVARQRVAEA